MTIEGFIEPKELECIVYDKLSSLGIRDIDYPIDPFEIIKNEGILLKEIPFDDNNIKGMLVIGDNISGIAINSNRCEVSKRFIATHELSHYWYHPPHPRTVCLEDYPIVRKGIEWQANNAAAYALMPSNMVVELYDYCNGSINYMCDFFKVARDSMEYRIKELKLKPHVNIIYGQNSCRNYGLNIIGQSGIGGWL